MAASWRREFVSISLIANIAIEDRDRYRRYEAGFMEIFGRYDGELLAVDEKATVLEGEHPYTRTVLIRFPSQEQADAWYHSPEYQALAQHRFASSRADIVSVQGLA